MLDWGWEANTCKLFLWVITQENLYLKTRQMQFAMEAEVFKVIKFQLLNLVFDQRTFQSLWSH